MPSDLAPALEAGLRTASEISLAAAKLEPRRLESLLESYEEQERAIEEAMPPPPDQRGWQRWS